ncbi:MAG TPA: succinylglutamate desuccinylase/aspartoacylase family protein [Methanobacterium sp.]|nr:succinylglutamate desuccinylase/aspartoacylase family protein [Methanobacterium sp.]
MALKNITTISNETKGEIEKNIPLMEYVPESEIMADLVNTARSGTPLLKIGQGFPKVMITAGIHGNELPPQVAAIRLIDYLSNHDMNGTVYIIPFAVPHATMENSRRFKGVDMNRAASKGGFISNNILNVIKDLEINAVGDFHSTKPGSNPGVESVFCSKSPCYKSYLMARHITEFTSSKIICHKEAGALYNGALEDECNLEGVPAVTCEVVSQNGLVTNKGHERSYLQMISYLKYFNII